MQSKEPFKVKNYQFGLMHWMIDNQFKVCSTLHRITPQSFYRARWNYTQKLFKPLQGHFERSGKKELRNRMGSDKLNLMKMLKYMRKNDRLIKLEELAENLETSERAVRRYKELLVDAGHDIVSNTGKDGGYYLHCERMTLDEWQTIEERMKQHPQLLRKLKDAYFNYLY